MSAAFQLFYHGYGGIFRVRYLTYLRENMAYLPFVVGGFCDEFLQDFFHRPHSPVKFYPVRVSPHRFCYDVGAVLTDYTAHKIFKIKIYQHFADVENNIHNDLRKLHLQAYPPARYNITHSKDDVKGEGRKDNINSVFSH